MSRRITCALLVACGSALPACEEASAPTDPEVAPEALAFTTWPSGLPHEYREEPSLNAGSTAVWFDEDRGYGRARMSFNANRARQTLVLHLRQGGATVATTPVGKTEYAHPIPNYGSTIFTSRSISVGEDCGYSLDGYGQHRVWNAWLINTSLFTWGHQESESMADDSQPECQEGIIVPGGSSNEEGCYDCQQWFYIVNGQIVDEWWECDQVDDNNCG